MGEECLASTSLAKTIQQVAATTRSIAWAIRRRKWSTLTDISSVILGPTKVTVMSIYTSTVYY